MNTTGFANYPDYNQGILKIPEVLNTKDSPRIIAQTVSNDIYRPQNRRSGNFETIANKKILGP